MSCHKCLRTPDKCSRLPTQNFLIRSTESEEEFDYIYTFILSELIMLEDALSYIPPHINYSPHGTISKNTTKVGGKPLKKVLLWKDFFNMVNEHCFDNKQPRFQEPQFVEKFKVTN